MSPKKAREFALKLGYMPEQFVELVIQDMLDQDGLDMKVQLKAASGGKLNICEGRVDFT